MQHSRWLAKLGAVGYDSLILINTFANFFSEKILRKGKISFSKKIKNSIKSTVKFISNFENTAADIGIHNGYDYVICGHIHQPVMREISNANGSIMYLNSGDWIENLTALEYDNGEWHLYSYHDSVEAFTFDEEEEEDDPGNKEIFTSILKEFNLSVQY
jgi:UDP-2,3-diacylglucosamine pyrophosphatase LpxH